MIRIYVASSWRNQEQQTVVTRLREFGHKVYDFKNPPGKSGFSWRELDPNWEKWTSLDYVRNLAKPTASHGYLSDYRAMQWADTCVLVLPCGRSAHIEAGYFNGAGKRLLIYIPERQEPELMYLMANNICLTMSEVLTALQEGT